MQDILAKLIAGDIPYSSNYNPFFPFDKFSISKICQGSEELYAQAWEWAHGKTDETCGLLAAKVSFCFFSQLLKEQAFKFNFSRLMVCVSLPVQSRLCAVHSATSLNMVRSSHVRPLPCHIQGWMRATSRPEDAWSNRQKRVKEGFRRQFDRSENSS